MSYLKQRIRAFGFAFSGIINALKNETHLQLQLLIALFVIVLAFFFSITKFEWLILLSCISLVLALEMLNSAIEKLCDVYTKEQDPRIKYIKDVCAGAVLIAAIFSLIIGLIIFLPYVLG